MSSRESSQSKVTKRELSESDKDRDANFTQERLKKLRRRKYEFCRSELQLSKKEARQWAEAAIGTLLEE